ncbi:hypothetical protein FJT64_007156 [Amphibalanus amphitrite]|uniref:Uncharacterized protein n=1 Tax=Amphibalanus amphitrite TaxID=1232801 RepID=A0A6A4VME1_AMPAM|nr:hypothetical protein FJT64_007156 [Amphibalanus amphitrite]
MFEKDVIKGAVNPRSSRVMSEKRRCSTAAGAQENVRYLAEFPTERLADPADVAVWHRAIGSMTASFKRLSTAGKLSALHNFGAPAGGRRYGTGIGVQPTSVARRTPNTMRGQGRVSAGQPTAQKRAGHTDHRYAASSARRSAAPHSLSTFVGENRSWGTKCIGVGPD